MSEGGGGLGMVGGRKRGEACCMAEAGDIECRRKYGFDPTRTALARLLVSRATTVVLPSLV